MSKLCTKFLDQKRREIWEKNLPGIAGTGVLGGGTAIAFQLNHRVSYDFDIFYDKEITPKFLAKVNRHFGKSRIEPVVDSGDELSVIVDGVVKLTFLYFPFPALHELVKTPSLPLFNLADLASNKAYVIGRRPAYKDYVDLFFILKKGLKLEGIVKETAKRFGGNFSEKLFLEQLTYFEDLDTNGVDFLGSAYSWREIKSFLESQVKEYLKSG